MRHFHSQFRLKGLRSFSVVFVITAISLFLCVFTVFLIVGFGRAHWCVYTRSLFLTILTTDDPDKPPYFTGTWKKWRSDGTLKERLEVREGIPHGRFISWHEEGPKASEGLYKNGKMHGNLSCWYHNGQKRLESFYKDGVEHGIVSVWDYDGSLISVIWKYDGWDVLTLEGSDSDIPSDFTGTWNTRRADGSVKEQIEVEHGVRHGRFVTWHEDGTKASEGYYKDGKPHGKLTLWYPDGHKRNETFYKEGFEHGKVTMWDFHGNLLSVSYKYEDQPVSKEEFERLSTSGGKSTEGKTKNRKRQTEYENFNWRDTRYEQ